MALTLMKGSEAIAEAAIRAGARLWRWKCGAQEDCT